MGQSFICRTVGRNWASSDGRCMSGYYYEDAGMICFQYDDGNSPDCWHYFRDGEGLRAEYFLDGVPYPDQTYTLRETDAPQICNGPDVGV